MIVNFCFVKEVLMSPSTCMRYGTVVHEFIHSLGFFHEQSRPDRDQFIKIEQENVKPGKETRLIR
jgi:hypothetical protein